MLLTRSPILAPARRPAAPPAPPARPRGRVPSRWSPRPPAWRPLWRRRVAALAAHGLQFGADGKARFKAGKALFATPTDPCCCLGCPDVTGPVPSVFRVTFAGTVACACQSVAAGTGPLYYQEVAGEFDGTYDLSRLDPDNPAHAWYWDDLGFRPAFGTDYGCAWGLRVDVGLRVQVSDFGCPGTAPVRPLEQTTLEIWIQTRGNFLAQLNYPDPTVPLTTLAPSWYFAAPAPPALLPAGWVNDPFPQVYTNPLACNYGFETGSQAVRTGGTATVEAIF